MAPCTLTIELDEPDRYYQGGETISGQVVVQCEKDVKCQALAIDCKWATHGRGNVDAGIAESVNLTVEPWMAGQIYRYPFKLMTAKWPPTYFGNYVNVTHQVSARAKLAWQFDPKAMRQFVVIPSAEDDNIEATRATAAQGCGWFGWIFFGVFIAIFAVMMWFIVPFLLAIGIGIWLFRSFLPKLKVGNVTWEIKPEKVRGGEILEGNISFSPKMSSQINAVTCVLKCEEVCVSGSGSNRRTHRHAVSEERRVLMEATRIRAGESVSLPFQFHLSDNAPPSIELRDNDVKWTAELRIDIPSWPDWSVSQKVIVRPNAEAALSAASEKKEVFESSEWFLEVHNQLVQCGNDRQRLNLVLEAIREFEFILDLYDVRRSNSLSREVDSGGVEFIGFEDSSDSEIALHFANSMLVPGEDSTWRGKLQIVDYDSHSGRIIAKAIP